MKYTCVGTAHVSGPPLAAISARTYVPGPEGRLPGAATLVLVPCVQVGPSGVVVAVLLSNWCHCTTYSFGTAKMSASTAALRNVSAPPAPSLTSTTGFTAGR